VWAAVALSLAVVPFAVAGSGKTVTPFDWTAGAWVTRFDPAVAANGPKVQDEVGCDSIGLPLVEGGFTFDRIYNPATMRGTVTGKIVGLGPDTLIGTLRGVMTADGMSGPFEMTRTSMDWPGFNRIHGTWSFDGHLVAPGTGGVARPQCRIHFDAVEIGTFAS
jgi:hypothetical protein